MVRDSVAWKIHLFSSQNCIKIIVDDSIAFTFRLLSLPLRVKPSRLEISLDFLITEKFLQDYAQAAPLSHAFFYYTGTNVSEGNRLKSHVKELIFEIIYRISTDCFVIRHSPTFWATFQKLEHLEILNRKAHNNRSSSHSNYVIGEQEFGLSSTVSCRLIKISEEVCPNLDQFLWTDWW